MLVDWSMDVSIFNIKVKNHVSCNGYYKTKRQQSPITTLNYNSVTIHIETSMHYIYHGQPSELIHELIYDMPFLKITTCITREAPESVFNTRP
jgi:hypothetical protein